jgi:hypothetical protein
VVLWIAEILSRASRIIFRACGFIGLIRFEGRVCAAGWQVARSCGRGDERGRCVWISWGGLLAGEKLAVGAVGEKIAGAQARATLAEVTSTSREEQMNVAGLSRWKSWRLARGGNSFLMRPSISVFDFIAGPRRAVRGNGSERSRRREAATVRLRAPCAVGLPGQRARGDWMAGREPPDILTRFAPLNLIAKWSKIAILRNMLWYNVLRMSGF